MVFSNYSNTSYLPLDNDQGVTFYKNENLLFTPPPAAVPATAAGVTSPSTLICRRNTAAAAMLTATTGASPFGSQALQHHGSQHRGNICDDFQPVAHLSSNGYYGYVPASAMPKSMMSTEGTPPPATVAINNSDGIGVLLDCHSPAVAVGRDSNSCSMMDCGEVENYHHLQHQQQQQHLRKRKENSEEVEGNCKRRKTWLEQPHDADFTHTPNWQQVQQMECHDQPMDTYSAQQFNGSPVTMNAARTAFNGFQLHHQQPQLHQALITSPPLPAAPQPQTILQPKSKYTDTSRCMMSHMI